jgi:hypothetical protein
MIGNVAMIIDWLTPRRVFGQQFMLLRLSLCFHNYTTMVHRGKAKLSPGSGGGIRPRERPGVLRPALGPPYRHDDVLGLGGRRRGSLDQTQ